MEAQQAPPHGFQTDRQHISTLIIISNIPLPKRRLGLKYGCFCQSSNLGLTLFQPRYFLHFNLLTETVLERISALPGSQTQTKSPKMYKNVMLTKSKSDPKQSKQLSLICYPQRLPKHRNLTKTLLDSRGGQKEFHPGFDPAAVAVSGDSHS